ncbi:MAG: HD domain-containing protein [Bacteroidota bacterium]|nr:HD domain-containing protein [Bacteroidota bacterium]
MKLVLQRVQEFATSKIASLHPGYRYHCVEHTAMVVEYARVIAEATRLSDAETSILLIAAWLHDVGFDMIYIGHEEESCKFAREVLAREVSSEIIADVEEGIRATEIPQRPTGRIAQVLCDADLFYLGTDLLLPWSDRLREEHLHALGREYTDLEWLDINIQFIRSHTFFTDYAREQAGPGLADNLQMLETMRMLLIENRAL